MSLPGNAAVAASGADLVRLAKDAGEQVMALLRDELRPSAIMTPAGI